MADCTPASPDLGTQVLDAIGGLKARQETLETQLRDLATQNAQARSQGPFVRTGESALTSRGFSYVKLFGVLSRNIPLEYAKVERDRAERLKAAHEKVGYARSMADSVMVPLASSFLSASHLDTGLINEVREVTRAGVAGFDAEEVLHLRKKYWGQEKALSWIDEHNGGNLVGPPQFGELIDLLRNNEIFMQAGARTIGMPPNGRITWPRHTGAASAYWVGESKAFTASEQTVDDLILQAKKLGVLVKIPNELFRYASISVEQFVREDMAKAMSLEMDKTFLEAVGHSNRPKGLINYDLITQHTAATVGANGNTFEAVDPAQMIGKVEEQNAIFKAFVMRPLLYTAISTRRASVYDGSSTVQEGPFLFSTWRTMEEQYVDPTRQSVGKLNGYPVYKSTQVSNTRTKGSGTNLSYVLGGDFADYMIAMSGSMEFSMSKEGDTPFTTDQTWVKGLMFCDGAPRREASFIFCDNLLVA